ncbi:hypothetical protein AB4Y45_33685 [Paraburkholderia sp. EG287A]|uniref:hypothetical protein n=1 Tax=Paraburkholderia sp. EG287A TaxID=3237012 RepID=UPI0034D19AE3
MKHTRLIALVAALALVASPLTWARSGFSSSRGSSISTPRVSVSAPSVSRGSGFGSMRGSGYTSSAATAPATVAAAASPRPATSGFGSSLYAATASKQAANTYAANKAAAASPNDGRYTQSVASNTVNAGGGNTYNSYHYNSVPAYSPEPRVVHHYHDHYYDSGSGTHNFLLGWVMGRATEPHTVVVQQPAPVQYVDAQPQYAPQYAPAQAPAQGQYEPQPAGVVTQAGVQPSAAPAQAQAQAASSAWTNAAQPGAQNVSVPPQQKSGHPVLHFFAWVAGIGVVGFGLYKLLSTWSARKARYTPTNHYKL